MNQCFLISLPRSGSTLLQRLLAAHPRIETVGEPWLALPFVYALRKDGLSAEYGTHSFSTGVREFVNSVPGGAATWLRESGAMLKRLYEARGAAGKKASNGLLWFLDKTPRYFLILDELQAMFPDAKFIVLQRNPLSVVASILNTWHNGRFNPKTNELDIYEGPRRMAEFTAHLPPTAVQLRFEDLVTNPEKHLRVITDFLGLEPLAKVELPREDSVKRAALGDKTGIHKFSTVSSAPVDSWKTAFASPIRKRWAARYLDWLGDDTLNVLGYDRAVLLQELRSAGVSIGQFAGDVLDCHVRLAPLLFSSRLDFVKTVRRNGRLHYCWNVKR